MSKERANSGRKFDFTQCSLVGPSTRSPNCKTAIVAIRAKNCQYTCNVHQTLCPYGCRGQHSNMVALRQSCRGTDRATLGEPHNNSASDANRELSGAFHDRERYDHRLGNPELILRRPAGKETLVALQRHTLASTVAASAVYLLDPQQCDSDECPAQIARIPKFRFRSEKGNLK